MGLFIVLCLVNPPFRIYVVKKMLSNYKNLKSLYIVYHFTVIKN